MKATVELPVLVKLLTENSVQKDKDFSLINLNNSRHLELQ